MKIVRSSGHFLARAISLGPYQRIVVGPLFDTLSPGLQYAILAHESGHIKGHHTEWRIVVALICPFPKLLKWLCHRHEFAADMHAARAGFVEEMKMIVAAGTDDDSFTHPSKADRLKRLEQYEFKLALYPLSTTPPGSA